MKSKAMTADKYKATLELYKNKTKKYTIYDLVKI